MSSMITPLHQQLRTAREAHGYSQEKLAALAGLVRTDIARIERGDNVTIRKIEAYIGALPHLQSLQFGGVEIKGRISADVDTVRQMVLDMVTIGANVLQLLGEIENEERDSAYPRKPAVSPALKEHLRRIDPTYKAAQAARNSAPPATAPADPDTDTASPPQDES